MEHEVDTFDKKDLGTYLVFHLLYFYPKLSCPLGLCHAFQMLQSLNILHEWRTDQTVDGKDEDSPSLTLGE